ncbi:MAG: molybdenum cofactor biosynthesis enzyme MoaA [Flavobacteriales bacterium]
MNLISTTASSFSHTSTHEPRGYIDSVALKELWFHTGTACNLACPFCLEGSKPGDDRLQRVSLDDVKPYMLEALDLGVEKFSFTGGEPFVVKDLGRILAFAADLKPCLVLTNGTDAVYNREKTLRELQHTKYPIAFRVSLDYADAALHDDGRGEGSFDQAIRGIRLLQSLGFKVSIARQAAKDENSEAVDAEYRQLLDNHQIDSALSIISFPDFQPPNSVNSVPEISERCMTRYHDENSRKSFMCAYSRMLVKQNGRMTIYSCTLVDDDDRYAFHGSLRESLEQRTLLTHHRCFSCFSLGASCSE